MSLFRSIAKAISSPAQNRRRRKARPPVRNNLRLESLERRNLLAAGALDSDAADPLACYPESSEPPAQVASAESSAADHSDQQAVQPVLMVISNRDFWYQDYADTRASLQLAGLQVVVAAKTTEPARPHDNSGQGADDGVVTPDLALADVSADDYSAIVFVGGWGMASYQYGFEGTYHNSAYNGDSAAKDRVNSLVNEFLQQDKHVAAICYGVSVLAYARVDGVSPLAGLDVTGYNGGAPWADGKPQYSRAQIESNGARMAAEGSVGDPTTSHDDVIIDGHIITAQDWRSAEKFGQVVAEEVIRAAAARDAVEEVKPVLMVIANRDFYHREYFETRESLEAAGLEVAVAAATTETATPHAISVVAGREPNVQPDIALADASADDYSAIVFVGGYGAASYQYAFESTYDNPAYRGDNAVKAVVNDLINDFVDQDKYVTAICNGVSVLAWARVDGESLIDGRHVAAWAFNLPSADGGVQQFTRQHIEANGGIQFASQSIGDPATATDDVFIDGRIITAENYDSAYLFGATIAERLLAES